jgi:hypothetical protein
MQNIGEEICGEYLKNIIKCDFITYNVTNPDIQGEMDVVGIKIIEREVYVCEVATHTGGLQYVTNKQPDDYNRFYSKFKKNIEFARKYFKDYTIIPMLWSPVVKISNPKAKYDTSKELERLRNKIDEEYELKLGLITNIAFHNALSELKEFASHQSAMLTSSVMRMFQIEASLEKHLSNLKRRKLID